MSTINRTYGDRPCVNTGDIDAPLHGYSLRKAVDECWCGERKHIKQMVCWQCQKLVEGKE